MPLVDASSNHCGTLNCEQACTLVIDLEFSDVCFLKSP